MSGGQGGLWRDGLLAAGKVGRVRWLGEREERIPSCNRGLFPHALYLIFVFQFFFSNGRTSGRHGLNLPIFFSIPLAPFFASNTIILAYNGSLARLGPIEFRSPAHLERRRG
jgi:hypothetical protein